MEKVYYDVIENISLITEPKNFKQSKKYFLIENTLEEKKDALKKFISNFLSEIITKNNNKDVIRLIVSKPNYGQAYKYLKVQFGRNRTNEDIEKLISSVSISRVVDALQKACDELYKKYNILVFKRKYPFCGVAISLILFPSTIIKNTTYTSITPKFCNLAVQLNNDEIWNVSLSKEYFAKLGKDVWTGLKIDIASYVKSIKDRLAISQKKLTEIEKKLVSAQKEVNAAQKEYDSLEDYEKLIGELEEDA